MKYLFKPFAFGLLAAVLCLPGHGQTYPTKTIRLVVPYPAGGATDYVARLFGERLSKSLGQPVMVDNKAGAAGNIGVAEVAKAEGSNSLFLQVNKLNDAYTFYLKKGFIKEREFKFDIGNGFYMDDYVMRLSF